MPSKQGESAKKPRRCNRCHQGIIHTRRASQIRLTMLSATMAASARMVARVTAGNQWCARSWSLTDHPRAGMRHTAAVVLVRGGRPRRCEGPGSQSSNRQRGPLSTAVGLANPWAIALPPKSLHRRTVHQEVLPAAGRHNQAVQAAGAGPHLQRQAAEVARMPVNLLRRL